MRASVLQSNFTAGEISPLLLARADIAKYSAGAELLENFLILPFGGLKKRPGMRYLTATKTTNKTILIPFRFSIEQTYMIEAGPNYFRFFSDRAIVTVSDTDLTPYEIASPYTEEMLHEVKFVQSADILFITHPQVRPKQLMRYGPANWQLIDFGFKDGPYLDVNPPSTGITIALSASSGTVTATANAAVFDAARDVGRCLRVGPVTDWGWGYITAVASTSSATVQIQETPGSTVATTNWRLGAWYVGNWPSVATFHEERLWFAKTATQPQTVWASRTGDFNNFSPTSKIGTADEAVLDDSGVTYTLGADDVNAIRWLVSTRNLVALTDSAEFSLAPGSSSGAGITPTSVRVKRETRRGCADVRPVLIDSVLLFIQRHARKMREYSYNYLQDSAQSIDITIMSEHISKSGFVSMAYQQEPYSMIWATREDGELVTLTFNKDQQVVGWARHPLPGTDARAEYVASIPGDVEDDVYIITTRTVGGQKVQYLEAVDPEFYPANEYDKNEAFFLDCALSYHGSPTSRVIGMSHLVGETVSIMADGSIYPDQVVADDGSIDLTQYEALQTASVIHVGYNYLARLKTIRFEAGAADGTSQTRTGRIHKVGLIFNETLGVKVGVSEDKLEELLFRYASDSMDISPPLRTGSEVLDLMGSEYALQRQFYLESYQPYPCTVLAVVPWLVVHN